jgi:imidazolonepropionase
MWDRLFVNVRLATMAGGAPYGAIDKGALAVADGLIAFAGPQAELPGPPESLAGEVENLEGRWITPGLIDCHTHLVYGGDRAREFELRLEGASYEEIARAGGGIVSTVAKTRAASRGDLLAAAAPRLRALMAEGVTTVEIKSGYGLDLENELKQLWVARQLGAELPVGVRTTFLGAHALPPEADGDSAAYIDAVVDMIPQIKASGLADALDAFCEKIAFSPEETAKVFTAARAHGLPVKLHADQLSDLGGAALAARFGALSADHLEFTSKRGVAAMAKAGTVAVLAAAGRGLARGRSADRACHRQQSRLLARDLASVDAEHGGNAVPHDARGGPARGDLPRRAGARAGRHARHAHCWQNRRPRRVGDRASGRAGLSDRVQSPGLRAKGRPPPTA